LYLTTVATKTNSEAFVFYALHQGSEAMVVDDLTNNVGDDEAMDCDAREHATPHKRPHPGQVTEDGESRPSKAARPPCPDSSAVKGMKVDRLRAALVARGLDGRGLKAELVARLMAAYAQSAGT
jgi:hypothetical protein